MHELVCSSPSCRARLRLPESVHAMLHTEGMRAYVTRLSRWTWHPDSDGKLEPLCGRCSRDL
jgi:hypothetical protein